MAKKQAQYPQELLVSMHQDDTPEKEIQKRNPQKPSPQNSPKSHTQG
jgi:hypothetical protein